MRCRTCDEHGKLLAHRNIIFKFTIQVQCLYTSNEVNTSPTHISMTFNRKQLLIYEYVIIRSLASHVFRYGVIPILSNFDDKATNAKRQIYIREQTFIENLSKDCS